MKNFFLGVAVLFFSECMSAQTGSLKIIIGNNDKPINNASVFLLNAKDSQIIKIQVSDTTGVALFSNISEGSYLIKANHIGYKDFISSKKITVQNETVSLNIQMDSLANQLEDVTVQSHKQFIQLGTNKTVINMDASLTNIGTSVLETLEKLPGVTVDRNGTISLKNKAGVMILIDGKQTYLSGSDLIAYLNALSSDQVSTIEIEEHPSSKYEAQGNAGVINIKTKKSNKQGVFGSFSPSFAQGKYPKQNNSFIFNWHQGAINFFLNYNLNFSTSYTTLYAYRKYLADDNATIKSILVQDFFDKTSGHSQSLKTGVDYTINPTTTVGVSFNGIFVNRPTYGNSYAKWQNAQGIEDSSSTTALGYFINFRNVGISANLHKDFSKKTSLDIDGDAIGYHIHNTSTFENTDPSTNITETYLGDMPTKLNIISGKADFTHKINDNSSWEAGWKSSHTSTNNLEEYNFNDGLGSGFKEDLAKSNDFLYDETNHAVYADAKTGNSKWSLDAGLRYEFTSYKGHQLGNALIPDTTFSKKYNSLFPNVSVSYTLDSSNEFSLTVDRRIDRPAFQKLNPFTFIINKYTYQTGNPGFLPAFTWSASLSHNYKGILISEISFSKVSNYFSQLFYSDKKSGLVIYTEGNIGSQTDIGLSLSLQLSPLKWWSFTSGIAVDDKTIKGDVITYIHSHITEATFNMNNQLHFKKNWSAEISGSYTSKSQNDIQEVLDPFGQLAASVSKLVWKNKLNIKVGMRDIFHTQWMEGLTQFQFSNEYFKETYDTRVIGIALTYKFGKTFKTNHRTDRAAEEEIERAGG
ncbi:MAG TPA: outer membrane beta-barrel protein [Parafilimonas sp.]|nr:outer membrane beta-barrel protein [Parafilimonas sp.]